MLFARADEMIEQDEIHVGHDHCLDPDNASTRAMA